MQLDSHQFKTFIKARDIEKIVTRLATEINNDYMDSDLIIIGVMNGSFQFLADLSREITCCPEIYFVKYTSYQGTSPGDMVNREWGDPVEINNRNVLIVEDIVDSGNTLKKLYEDFKDRNPASLKIATLLLKPALYNKNIPIDYVGREIPNDFVIGYGMDLNGKGRGLRDIYHLVGNNTQDD